MTYIDIAKYYENSFKKHGDTPQGLAWPDFEGMITRYQVMVDVHKTPEPATILDLGCGTGYFLPFIKENFPNLTYAGCDINAAFIHFCKNKYPDETFFLADILKEDLSQNYDFIIMNGIFTVKDRLTSEEMFGFLQQMLIKAFSFCSKGIAFNVMSKHVDWERDDLFHLSIDTLTDFIVKNLSRHFVIRNDYGMYEYTTYVYRQV